MPEFITIPEIVRAARGNLPKAVWDYASGGSETEASLRRNRKALESITFRPRVLVDVRERDTSTTFLGHKLSLPVMLAPVGSIALFHPQGALAAARVGARMGIITFVSTASSPVLEEVAAGAGGPLIFQLYVDGDHEWVEAIVNRVERSGYAALCVTVDVAVYSRRERDLHNRFFPREAVPRPNVASVTVGQRGDHYRASFTWDDLDWLRSKTALPMILKGVLSPEDAALAVEHGMQGIYVSNHGGRQLDGAPAPIEVLPEIVKAVGGRAEVIVDGGFVRGTDVVKGLALGARTVGIGKLLTWGLAAGGEDGLEKTLELLQREISMCMALLGVRDIGEIGPHVVRCGR